MELIFGLFVNIISAPVLFALGYMANEKVGKAISRSRNPLKLASPWNFKGSSQLTIIHGCILDENINSYSNKEGDIAGLVEINTIVSSLTPPENIMLQPGNGWHPSSSEQNLLCFSGPKWNAATRRLWGELGTPVWFDRNKKCIKHNEALGIPDYTKVPGANGSEAKCFGVVMAGDIEGIDDRPTHVLICCGLSTLSSCGSAYILRHLHNKSEFFKRNKEQMRKIRGKKWLIEFCIERVRHNATGGVEVFNPKDYKISILHVFGESDFVTPYEYKY